MSNQPVKILLIEDNPGDVRLVQEMLADARAGTDPLDFDLTPINQLDQALALLNKQEVDLILVDLSLPDSQGLETVHQVIETAPNLPVIVMSGLEDEALAIDAVQAGAQDYLVKGYVDSYSLVRAIRYAQERKRSEQALRRSELFNRAVLSSVTAHIAVLDQTGKIIATNEAWEQFARQNGDTLLARTGVGMNYLEVCRQAVKENSAGAQQALEGIRAVLNGTQNQFIFEYPCHSPTEERWFLMVVTPMLNEQSGVVVVHENITERIQTEQEIQRRNRELALFNRIIAASAAGLEPDTILETACRELAEIFDIPHVTATLLDSEKKAAVVTAEYRAKGRPSTLGMSIPIAQYPSLQALRESKGPLVIPDAQSDPRLAPLQELLRQFGTKSLLILPLKIKGEIAGSLSLEAQEIRTFSTGEINLAWSVADQVSGAVARVQLDQERRLLSAVVKQTAESVIVTDTSGTILYVNPAFEQISGYSRSEVIGQTPRILESGQHDREFFQELWSTIKAGKVWQGRFVNKRKDGTLYTEDATIAPVRDENGNIVSFVSVQRDVTQEIRREEQLRQSQKMEAVGRLAGGVAHDFNNLLTVISGYAELLLQRYSDTGDPTHKDIEQIKKAGDRASALTRQLLAFSRKQVVQPKLLNLNDILVDIDKMLQRLIGEDIELVSKPTQNLWPVKADPSQIEQIIINLAVNARDAMPHGGQLTIETDNVELDKEYTRQHVGVEPGRYALLAVSDTGVGMDAETRANIFEPFFTTKGKDTGTGLGLATVYGIVKQNDGHIWVYSELGQGTAFKIYLPRAENEDEMSHPSQPPMAVQTSGGETVLLVEDETMVRELARRVLQKYGYTVLVARNGREALEIVKEHQNTIHLLLTDVVMPGGLSGRQLASQLSAQYPKMKILYMSGYTGSAVVRHGVLEADVSFLQKPFTPDGLINKIREVLNTDTPSSL